MRQARRRPAIGWCWCRCSHPFWSHVMVVSLRFLVQAERRGREESAIDFYCVHRLAAVIFTHVLCASVYYILCYKASLLTCFLTHHASLPQKKTTIACARGSQSGACSSASSATPDRSWGAASSSWMLWYDCDCWFQLWNLNRTSPPFFFSSFSFFFFFFGQCSHETF